MAQKPWMTIAALFAFGIGIGFLAGNGMKGRGRDREDVVYTQPRGPYGQEKPDPTEGAGPGEPVAVEFRTLEEVISAIPVPKAEAGTGEITGRVTTVNGKPLEGVTVRAERTRPTTGGDRPKEEDFETRVREFVSRARWKKATRRETLTSADGSFILTGLADDLYSIKAFKEGYDIQPGDWIGSDKARPGDAVVFLATARIAVRIAILLPDGSQPSRAEVRIGGPRYWGSTEPWTPQDPVLRRPPGTYRFTATAGDREEYDSDAKIATLVAGAPTRTVTLRLKKIVGIKGKVRLPEGLERNYVRVWALHLPPGQASDTKELLKKGKSIAAHSRNNYRFSFQDTPPGLYLVGASLERTRIGASTTVEVSDGLALVELVLSMPADWRSIPLRVFDPKGELLWDVTVNSRYRSGRGWFREGGTPAKQADGSFLIAHPARDEEEKKREKEGKYVVEALSRRYGRKEVEYRLEDALEILVRFEDPAHLEAVVSGFKDHEHKERIGLNLEPKKEPGVRTRRYGAPYGNMEPIDEEGRKSFGPVQPGNYELVLRISTTEDSFPVEKAPVTLRHGKNRAVIEIPALHPLTLRFGKAKAGTRVWLTTEKGERLSWSTAAKVGRDGEATFPFLPAGSYTVSLSGGMLPQVMKVSVPGPEVVRFEARPVNALRVTVTDEGGELAKLGLRTGDLVIGMDGKEFGNTQEFQAMVFVALGKKSVKLLVLRKDERLEFEADPRKLLKMEGGLGGSFYPTSR
ncbi:MAG: carboxypeptidase-like regulatory domain-containing protein [Planctomycetota bacterium]|jgi:hypothetical protein